MDIRVNSLNTSFLQDAFPGFPHHREAYGEIGKQVPYKRYILSLEEGGVSSIQDEPSEEQ